MLRWKRFGDSVRRQFSNPICAIAIVARFDFIREGCRDGLAIFANFREGQWHDCARGIVPPFQFVSVKGFRLANLIPNRPHRGPSRSKRKAAAN